MGTIFVAGGIVMWPLLIFSLTAIALVIERLVFWFRINRRQRRVMQDILRTYQHSPLEVFPKLKQNADLPVVRVCLEALAIEGASPKQFHLALMSGMQAELPRLRRFGTIFSTIVSLSPLLGLLGTILGLITSFASLDVGDIGGSNTAGVTGGISEALISTAAGLVVAMSTLFFASLFRGLYKRQVAMIQEYGGQLEILYENHYNTSYVSKERAYVSP